MNFHRVVIFRKENGMQIRKLYIAAAGLVVLSGVAGAAGGILAQHIHTTQNANSVSEVTGDTNVHLTSASQGTEQSIASLVSSLSPAVVSITTQSTSYSFFGGPQTTQGAGTGMILTSSGYILTNNHVLPADSGAITVTMLSGKQYTAHVVAADATKDLALIKINASGLPTVTLGDSSQEQVGNSVVGIGNALGQFQNSVINGIISGTNRSVQASDSNSISGSESLSGLLQTDAPINPGDSGGPLIDQSTGEVIGIDTAVSSNAQGIGFAIPINEAKSFIAPYVDHVSI